MLNYNPETVSTDYDECERLYFDEISFEVSVAQGSKFNFLQNFPNRLVCSKAIFMSFSPNKCLSVILDCYGHL